MKQEVIISIKSVQTMPNEAPEAMELMTTGTLEKTQEGFSLCYQESPLTGLEGTTTVLRVEDRRVHLERTGAVESQMEFEKGMIHDSLYQIEGGALLLRVYTRNLFLEHSTYRGSIFLSYMVEIENFPAGMFDYTISYQVR